MKAINHNNKEVPFHIFGGDREGVGGKEDVTLKSHYTSQSKNCFAPTWKRELKSDHYARFLGLGMPA